MSNETRFPQRLDIKDMPRDSTRALGGLRQALAASFNYCRKYPAKMEVLKEVIKYTYNRIVTFEKEQEAFEEQRQRNAVLTKATELGIDLDERLSTDKLKAALSDALTKKAAEDAAKASESTDSTEQKDDTKTTGDKQ
ncbi:hypothetical protein vBAmePR8F_gp52 [Alteromonas phage vB_AmeP_R8W]|uniref:Uncharacterized protein n=1 Tax=Alteromonas phage vB_AmeP_R8W TaxID=2774152 RepID=A0A8E4RFZ9_9CAUD|nr:hypothetical protein vBAmePR8F_gp52 [Alteromonas phage vB_AmeP_R8W]